MAETLAQRVAVRWAGVLCLGPLAIATIQQTPGEMLPKIGIEVLKLIGLLAILFAVHVMDERGWLP